jgi:hypothetical protein
MLRKVFGPLFVSALAVPAITLCVTSSALGSQRPALDGAQQPVRPAARHISRLGKIDSRSSATRPIPGLHVEGENIVDRKGRRIRLLGVNRSGSEFECIQGGTANARGWGIFDGPVDLPSAKQIAAWHTNVVRVPLNEDCWLGINGVRSKYGGRSYRVAIERYVSTLHHAGLYVVLDLHWSAPGNIPAEAQQPMPDADHAPAFWRSVARAFKGDDAVAFDLYNEPFLYASYLQNPGQNSWACWRNGCKLSQYLTGGSPYTKHYSWQAAGMQALVNAVRGTGARNLILVGGLNWANDLSGWRTYAPADPEHNLAVSWHSYPGEACGSVTCWQQVVAPLASQVPIVVGETGDNTCTSATYDAAFLPWADRHNLSYLGWTWNPWHECRDVLITGYDGSPTKHYGQYFQAHLAALASIRASRSAPARSMPPPPPLYVDSFRTSRSGGAPKDWTTSGGHWVVASAGRGTVRQTNTGNSNTKKLLLDKKGWANYAESVRVQTPANGLSAGIAGRCRDAGDCYVLILRSDDSWYLGKWVNDTWITLAHDPFKYSGNTWHTLGLAFTGSSITASVDNAPVGTVSDSSFLRGTVALVTRGAATFETVRVTPG